MVNPYTMTRPKLMATPDMRMACGNRLGQGKRATISPLIAATYSTQLATQPQNISNIQRHRAIA